MLDAQLHVVDGLLALSRSLGRETCGGEWSARIQGGENNAGSHLSLVVLRCVVERDPLFEEMSLLGAG